MKFRRRAHDVSRTRNPCGLECGLTRPRIAPMTDRSARFWNRIAERYARQPVADEASYRRKLDITRQYLRADTDVFEFGCGTGSTALAHAPHVHQIEAIDVSPKMIAIARDKAAAAGIENVRFICAGIADFTPGNRPDVVLGLSILHLLPDRDDAIAKVYGLLKPGGRFVTSTACLADMPIHYRLLGVVLPLGAVLGVLPTVRVFSEQELADSLVASGFDIEHRWRPARDKAAFIVARKPE
ncbi:class I SAM-dependent methyltransferase [Sinimarinibacterium flocculans]|uniref:class I SAM-dependent methyltransferase n=1 Tax=Sinimarinibacterium flocculans TaxID=985250 RepID=UPI003517BD5A